MKRSVAAVSLAPCTAGRRIAIAAFAILAVAAVALQVLA